MPPSLRQGLQAAGTPSLPTLVFRRGKGLSPLDPRHPLCHPEAVVTMHLLVTGGAGFIGSNVIHRIIAEPVIERLVNLACLTYAGHLENLERVGSNPKYVFEKVDLRDKKAVVEVVRKHAITHVLHLAAESHVDRSIAGPGDFIHTNVVGTFNLLEACRALWGTDFASKRFHHVSTDEVYGSLGPTGHFTE